MKKIVVLGGGTAGWMTALLARRYYRSYEVTVVESEDLGILGAGEGTVPHFINILNLLGIPVSDIVKECAGTIKTGIRFCNWNGDGDSYFHSFGVHGNVGWNTLDAAYFQQNLILLKQISDGDRIDDISLTSKLSNKGLVPFIYNQKKNDADTAPFNKVDHHGNFALHFNARLLAKYFRKVAETRNIKRQEGFVDSINSNDAGNITELVLKDGTRVEGDFFFDCSGFARLLIGKHFGTEWVSYNDHLPLDTALPFFIEHDNKNLKPETEAIAMKYGWVWKIPVEGRYGCGYVFDSKFCTEAEAMAEVEEYFGMKLENTKTFKFKAGSFKETVVKNCMAAGLAQSFVEPLEATSIWTFNLNTIEFLQNNGVNNQSQRFREIFNENCKKRNDDIVAFLYLHYLTQRNDSDYWRNFRTNTKMIPQVEDVLNLINSQSPCDETGMGMIGIFPMSSWLQICDGQHLLTQDSFKQRIADMVLVNADAAKKQLINDQNAMIVSALTHDEFLQLMRGKL